MHLPCPKYLDLHWTLTVSLQCHCDHLLRLDVEVLSHTRGSTQVFIFDYNSIEIVRIFSSIHKMNQKKIKQDLNFKNSPKILLVELTL